MEFKQLLPYQHVVQPQLYLSSQPTGEMQAQSRLHEEAA